MKEFQEASTGLAASLPPDTPSSGLKDRILLAATGKPAVRPARLSRFLWSLAAAAVFLVLFSSLFGSWNSLRLEGTGPGRNATAMVRWNKRELRVEARNLPPLPKGKVYQLWHLAPAPVPARTFTLDPDGTLTGSDTLTQDMAPGHGFAFTVEPEGGSKAPTMPLYLAPRK